LETDEYNASPAAGYFTPERVKEMLDNAAFAFLILTAEDEQLDGTMRARENVVHESGLFQGRLGSPHAGSTLLASKQRWQGSMQPAPPTRGLPPPCASPASAR
jgi:predicted nucleotide-binding protein with TIR-like domain